MRLIDADALIEAMKKTESEYENAMTCPSWWSAFNVISEQPTAYSVDKVVEELEHTMSNDGLPGEIIWNNVLKMAIEIVKQSGVDDDVCKWERDEHSENDNPAEWIICPHKPKRIFSKDIKYCPYCGKKDKGGGVMERLTNTGTNGEIWITDNDETRRFGRKESAYKKLAEYEDLEEQGLLLRLPCEVGSTVYAICTCESVGTVLDGTLYGSNGGFGTATGYYCPYELSDKCPHIDADDCDECKNIEAVFEDTIDYITITEYETIIGLHNTNLCVTIDEIGKTVFLTKAEAEQKLKEMESD